METKKRIKIIAEVSEETSKILDDVSNKSGIKKRKIVEDGIKLQCKKLTEVLGLEE